MKTRLAGGLLLAVCAVGAAAACHVEGQPAELPATAAVDSIYAAGGAAPDSVTVQGDVVEVRFHQPAEQLVRGGPLWARVGPYVYLFSPPTQALFAAHPDVAAVRVITMSAPGTEIARATLSRTTMTAGKWDRSLNLLGYALRDGTARPTRLEALVNWGERQTLYQYNPEFTRRRD